MTLIPEDKLNEAIMLKKKQAAYRRMLFSLIREITATALVAFIMFSQFFGITVQKGNDMYPAIRDGDIVFYYRDADPVTTDAVIYEQDGKMRVGRIAGKGGTVVSETGDHQLTFDGIYQPESKGRGIWDKTYAAEYEALPLTVPDGSYFILNDDRVRDDDSRTYGAVERGQIRGRVIAVLRRRFF